VRTNANGRSPASDTAAERWAPPVSAPTMTSAPSRSANAAPGIARAVSGSATSGRYSPQAHCPPVGFAAVAVADDTVHLGMLVLYAATGGVFFIQAGLLARRSHRLPSRPPPCRPE
jgi:hypothetical protein